ncbi:uncharacterized protein LOC107814135 isoform X1 [Nicotiana tabacum]|uniref:Uncharacterized protein isoform X1 n=4 Tax=Nicotiana TaxID=4085 RepID=A0A1S4C1C3_TOBAC|nr:PREDICTED: uncharacterized protein LOC107814135 isoform X1 [Nicotiana tabacum]XP_016494956.1 PREDICTED: uncharacterized protein LOC107814135 isoform X1 [Nicotiana tabacum]XP_016494957.1 PREDICTED: uncharacterized protein LOC107814135 isoform X1 [Nicotiana tabacum]XP_016494958.1 PREDICTED: uncharacterized protein LOC107814135 isoform X1 [Nicotiana tabacum]
MSRSIHSTSHSAPMDQPTLHAAPTFQLASQPSQSVYSTSQLAPMDQTASQPAPTVYSASLPSWSVHSTSHPAPTHQNSSQPAPTFQTTSRKHSGSHWTIEAIHSEENVKKLKVKVKEVLNLTCEERIVVDFDYLDEPFGDAHNLLSGFCEILACDCTLFPIHYEKWSSLPLSYFNRVFDQIIKPKFFFKTTESVARQHVYKSIGKKWAANKLNLWSAYEHPLKSRAEIIDNVSDGVPRDQWISFVDYQYKEAKEICEKIEISLSQSTMDESQIFPNDAVGKVLVKEHSGRVRYLGLGPVPSRVFKQVRPRFGGTSASSSEGSCSSQCQQNLIQIMNAHNQMMNALNQMMNAFKAYMIMKEGTIPKQFAGFFASPSTISPTTPSDVDNGPLSPMGARRSCGDSNSSDNR